jgi:hypothetical protein
MVQYEKQDQQERTAFTERKPLPAEDQRQGAQQDSKQDRTHGQKVNERTGCHFQLFK